MSRIETYVFLDLETTGLPCEEGNRTKITEISLVAVKRDHLIATRHGLTPRVQHKITLCLNPRRLVQPTCTEVTGLCNDLLEHEPSFDSHVFTIIDNFINILTKPVCLIAQNGLGFDYPILKNHLEKLQVSLSKDLMCADCYHAFYDIMEARKQMYAQGISTAEVVQKENGDATTSKDEIDLFTATNTLSMQAKNEETPQKPIIAENSKIEPKKNAGKDDPDFSTSSISLAIQKENESTPKHKPLLKIEQKDRISKVRRRFPWSNGQKPKEKYKLKDIYERLLNRPAIDAHRAENDCILALECSVVLGKEFVNWVDENHVPFTEIKPMTIGKRLGD